MSSHFFEYPIHPLRPRWAIVARDIDFDDHLNPLEKERQDFVRPNIK